MNLTGTRTLVRHSPAPVEERDFLRSWIEMGKPLMAPDASNFCAVTVYPEPRMAGGGVSYWITLPRGGPEIALIQRVNNAPYGSAAWHYLVRPATPGSLYQTMAADDDTPADLRWSRGRSAGSRGIRTIPASAPRLTRGGFTMSGVPTASRARCRTGSGRPRKGCCTCLCSSPRTSPARRRSAGCGWTRRGSCNRPRPRAGFCFYGRRKEIAWQRPRSLPGIPVIS